ncbi:MAG: hypothetical protein GY707_05870, partial [Desulfobacteraceae bacterium]|nr:hypothetical protein [Desulfobacteraceae bacterium]
MLPGAIHAVLLIHPPGEKENPQAILWPEGKQDYTVLSSVAKRAFHKQKAIVRTQNSRKKETGEPLDALACPFLLDNQMSGVVAIEITSRSKPMQKATVQQIQTGTKWL